MRLMMFSDSDVFAGTERHLSDLSAGLWSAGIRLTIACPTRSPLSRFAARLGLAVIPINKMGPLDFVALAALFQYFRSASDSLIHCHNGRTAWLAVLAKTWAKQGHVVLTQHFLSPSYATRRGWKRWVSNRTHAFVDRRIDHTIAISDAVREGVIARGEASPDRVTRVHNGCRISRDADGHASESRDRSLVFCAARLEREKRVDVLIDAMRIVARSRPEAQCQIAGDGRERPALQQKIETLGLAQNVRLLGFRDDVAQKMAAAQVFVLPTDVEGFGLVLLEAMDAETAVIATDAGGPREIVRPGQTGWLVRPNDAAALAHAILEALADPQRTAAMGAAGRARLLADFTAERMARETIEVYRRVLERPSSYDPSNALTHEAASIAPS